MGGPRRDGDDGYREAREHEAGAIEVIITGTRARPPRHGQDGADHLQDLLRLLDRRIGAHQSVERQNLGMTTDRAGVKKLE